MLLATRLARRLRLELLTNDVSRHLAHEFLKVAQALKPVDDYRIIDLDVVMHEYVTEPDSLGTPSNPARYLRRPGSIVVGGLGGLGSQVGAWCLPRAAGLKAIGINPRSTQLPQADRQVLPQLAAGGHVPQPTARGRRTVLTARGVPGREPTT